jgi:hypothetical protein
LIRSFFSRWRPAHLFLAWCAYWVALILVKLGPALFAGWQLSRPGTQGTANAGVTDGIISASISQSGHTMWSGAIPLTQLAMLVALPPLALWLVWLLASSRTNNAVENRLNNQTRERELHSTESRIGIIDTSSPSPSKRRVREES